MEIKAKLLEKYETASFGANGFQKREFVVEFSENSQYIEYIKFELVQDKCALLDDFNIGQEINLAFNLRGRKWTNPEDKVVYFNSLQAWKITAVNDVSTSPTASDQTAPQVDSTTSQNHKEPEWLNKSDDDAGDLPF